MARGRDLQRVVVGERHLLEVDEALGGNRGLASGRGNGRDGRLVVLGPLHAAAGFCSRQRVRVECGGNHSTTSTRSELIHRLAGIRGDILSSFVTFSSMLATLTAERVRNSRRCTTSNLPRNRSGNGAWTSWMWSRTLLGSQAAGGNDASEMSNASISTEREGSSATLIGQMLAVEYHEHGDFLVRAW